MSEGKKIILSVKNLTKFFAGILAVDDLSFDLCQGEVLGIIGPNGSGKTTAINCITGFIKHNSGKIYFKGRDITGMAPYKISKMGIGRTFQIVRPYHTLPAFKNLIVPLFSPRARKFAGSGKLGDRDAVAIDLLETVGFERDAHTIYKEAGALPLGYLKRLEIARCLAMRSEVIFCDEILSGLSAAEIGSLMPLLEKMKIEGSTLIMVEHRLRELFRIADRIIAMNFGQKIFEGNPADVMADEKLLEAYFGKDGEIAI